MSDFLTHAIRQSICRDLDTKQRLPPGVARWDWLLSAQSWVNFLQWRLDYPAKEQQEQREDIALALRMYSAALERAFEDATGYDGFGASLIGRMRNCVKHVGKSCARVWTSSRANEAPRFMSKLSHRNGQARFVDQNGSMLDPFTPIDGSEGWWEGLRRRR